MELAAAVGVFCLVLAVLAAALWGVPLLRRETKKKEAYGPPPGAGAPVRARGYADSAGRRAHGGFSGVAAPGAAAAAGPQGGHVAVYRECEAEVAAGLGWADAENTAAEGNSPSALLREMSLTAA